MTRPKKYGFWLAILALVGFAGCAPLDEDEAYLETEDESDAEDGQMQGQEHTKGPLYNHKTCSSGTGLRLLQRDKFRWEATYSILWTQCGYTVKTVKVGKEGPGTLRLAKTVSERLNGTEPDLKGELSIMGDRKVCIFHNPNCMEITKVTLTRL